MAAYATLKAAIQAVVKQNGNNEITGPILQQALLSMINSLGDGYQFKGVATPATNPGTPDQNVFYIASEVGTYSNFGLSVGENEVAVFLWNGTWSKQSTGAASVEAVNQLGQYVENPEWIWVVTENNGKVLFGFNKKDGSPYFGYGCPPQVVAYISKIITLYQLDSVSQMRTFLGALVESGTLTELLNGKVDKVTGKSLVDSNFATDVPSFISAIDNPEYLDVKTDSFGKVLEGIKAKGTKEINIPIETPSTLTKSIDNPEFVELKVDAKKRVYEGTKRNGKKYFPAGIEGVASEKDIKELKSYVDNQDDSLSDRISTIGENTPLSYFTPNQGEWVENETPKQFTPKQDVIEHKHQGNVTPQDRFAVWAFDDFKGSDFSMIIPLLNKYGAKGEFNKIFRNVIAIDYEKEQINCITKGRHEMGDHTWLHYKFPFNEPLFNGQNPSSPDGEQVAYPSNSDMRNNRGDGKNEFGIDITMRVIDTNGLIPIETKWGELSDAECQQIREMFSVMKDTDSNVITKLDELSNKYLGTSGSSNGSWNNNEHCYTGGIFTGCKTSANHEIWERYLLVTNMYLKEQLGLNYNLQTWSMPGSKSSSCYYEYNGRRYYDKAHTILANYLAKFPSSLYHSNDGNDKERCWVDVMSEFGYICTNDALDPATLDGQTKPCMSIQFIPNSEDTRPNALIYPNIRNKVMDYSAIAEEYTEGVDLQGTEPYEVQMYADTNSSFHKAVEGWRHLTANGIIVGQLTDSIDTWSERVIIEGILKYAKSAGIKLITLAEAYDVCFNNHCDGNNLICNPMLRNTAKEFMPTSNAVPDNPDGYIGGCSVTITDGEPILITSDTTIYEQYGIVAGKYKYSADVKGSGTITIKAIKNNTPYNDRGSATAVATITIDSSGAFTNKEEAFVLPYNTLTAYEQLCAGYGDKVIGIRIEYSSGLQIKNIKLTD